MVIGIKKSDSIWTLESIFSASVMFYCDFKYFLVQCVGSHLPSKILIINVKVFKNMSIKGDKVASD